MKLFIAAGIFHPESGGPATYLYEILPELQADGWDVRVVTYGETSNAHYPYPLTRIPRRALPFRVLDYARAAWPLTRWADLIYVHTLDLPLFGAKAKRVLKMVGDQAWERAIRKGWIPPTEDIDLFQTKAYMGAAAAQKSARSRQVQAMDGVIVPSQYLKRMVVGWGVKEDRVHVIYNALPEEIQSAEYKVLSTEFQEETSPPSPLSKLARGNKTQIREALGLPDAPTLLTAARLTPWKGVDHLITALSRTKDVRLLVAGDGEMLPTLQRQVNDLKLSDRVEFLGKVSREKMPLYMKAADYLALYSGYEGLSHTLLESLRAGTPVIASDKGGNPEVVQHGVNGLLVPYVDMDALTAAIEAAFQPGKRDALAAKADVGMERFQFANMVKQTSALLRKYV
ncbi:MAG: glycosyltransferase family 4 protein [Anaerolineae bacterium]|nr:glycosyltransferase family 4 protein [Anaerolineae bacterium]